MLKINNGIRQYRNRIICFLDMNTIYLVLIVILMWLKFSIPSIIKEKIIGVIFQSVYLLLRRAITLDGEKFLLHTKGLC